MMNFMYVDDLTCKSQFVLVNFSSASSDLFFAFANLILESPNHFNFADFSILNTLTEFIFTEFLIFLI